MNSGFPLWLHFVPGIQFRTDNEPFKAEMKRFTAKIVDMMKHEKFYASQGGPIVLSQIENEYGNIDSAYGSAAKTYIGWAASMASSLDTGVPWVMCQQKDAPDPMINTCNGFYCDQFTPNSAQKPKCGLRIGVDGKGIWLLIGSHCFSRLIRLRLLDQKLLIAALEACYAVAAYLGYSSHQQVNKPSLIHQ